MSILRSISSGRPRRSSRHCRLPFLRKRTLSKPKHFKPSVAIDLGTVPKQRKSVGRWIGDAASSRVFALQSGTWRHNTLIERRLQPG
ncbi:hypothetical protein M407DRAFT_190617 [Tulasnella calospora MUT 4182]|uniref:Uncharacterized protein n=1 Tax=Tulasnella calospora MUT 4182 TaxID=1051891 RepID=A0A0C3QAT5_9AGAM|nr:hypothetical protein M407DRAFT_190617 [Tulasnella calospora MUT 4182]